MEIIGAYEAKTNLPRLLHDVELGKAFIITRNGKPIAELHPITQRSVAEKLAHVRAFRERLRVAHGSGSVLKPGEIWRELIHSDDIS